MLQQSNKQELVSGMILHKLKNNSQHFTKKELRELIFKAAYKEKEISLKKSVRKAFMLIKWTPLQISLWSYTKSFKMGIMTCKFTSNLKFLSNTEKEQWLVKRTLRFFILRIPQKCKEFLLWLRTDQLSWKKTLMHIY